MFPSLSLAPSSTLASQNRLARLPEKRMEGRPLPPGPWRPRGGPPELPGGRMLRRSAPASGRPGPWPPGRPWPAKKKGRAEEAEGEEGRRATATARSSSSTAEFREMCWKKSRWLRAHGFLKGVRQRLALSELGEASNKVHKQQACALHASPRSVRAQVVRHHTTFSFRVSRASNKGTS